MRATDGGAGTAIGSVNITVITASSLTPGPDGEKELTCGGVESISKARLSSQNRAPVRFVAVRFTIASRASALGTTQEI